MIKFTILLKRKPSLTHEAFVDHHKNVHADLFMSVAVVKDTVRRYVQQHAIAAALPGMPPTKYDGMTELWFDDVDALGRCFSDPAYLEKIRPDEESFLDLHACDFIVSNENPVAAGVVPCPRSYTMVTEVDLDAVASLKETFAPDEPLFVVNLLKYRERALYSEGSPHAHISGRDAYYLHYLPAFASLNAGAEISPVWVGNVAGMLTGEDGERWDDVAIVHYPSFSAFIEAATSQAYVEQAEPHRRAAIEDFRLIAARKTDLPA